MYYDTLDDTDKYDFKKAKEALLNRLSLREEEYMNLLDNLKLTDSKILSFGTKLKKLLLRGEPD